MSNNWNQPPVGSQPDSSQPDGDNKNRVPRTGNLLSNYQQANEGAKQFSPISMPSRGSDPSSPLPPGQAPGMQLPPPIRGQMSPRSGLLSSARQSGQGALNNAVQMVRGMSGKMAAIGRPPMASPPPPDFRQSAPSPDSRQAGPAPDFRQAGTFGNAVQMVLSVSGKIAAISRQNIAPPPAPLVRYHPPVVSMPESTMPAAKRWKRSSAVRLATRIRHRRARMQGGSKRIAIGVLIALLVLLVIGSSSGTAYGYTYYQDQQPQLQSIANKQITQITHIYDRNGVLLKDVTDDNGGRRIYISYDQIPQVMDIAQMAAEDPTFMTNGGIDPQGLLRAVIYGGSAGGGSTITQQLIKMMRKADAYTIDRKLSEGALAIGLTQQYSKEKILEMYLNVAPYGILKLGIEDAAQEYFGLTRNCDKNFKCTSAISQLDYNTVTKKHDPLLAVARASLLASIPQNPSQFDLTLWETSSAYKAAVLKRQKNEVLSRMIAMGLPIPGIGPNGQPGLLTTAIVNQVATMSAAMTFTDHRPGVKAPHFVNWVVSQLAGILGNGDANLGAQILENGGYNIRTTLDANLETYVENSVKFHLTQSELQLFPLPAHYAILNQDNHVNDAAVVVMNAKNGEVLAMNGSLDYNSTDPLVGGQVNAAALSNANARQPGSTFKPIVYATTFEMGWSPGTVLPDYKTYFANGDNAGASVTDAGVYTPPDYGGTYHNLSVMPIRLATANSLNVPAVKAIAFAGLDNVIATAERMGITAIADKANQCKADGKNYTSCFGVSLVLGTTGVPLIQMVGAYQTFADQGVHVPPQSILDIWDNYGHNLYHFDPAHPQAARVLSAQVAYMMTSVLTDEYSRAMEFSGDNDLSFYDWPGNECYSRKPLPDCLEYQVAAKTGTTDNYVDNWAIGYTPDVVVGVWAGNADGSQMTGVVGITGAAPIWHGIMELVSGRPCVDGADKYGVSCSNFNQKALGFNDATFTQPAGIHQACLSSVNGLLAGTGTGCAYDWVLDGQDPIQTGILQAPTPATTPKGGNHGG